MIPRLGSSNATPTNITTTDTRQNNNPNKTTALRQHPFIARLTTPSATKTTSNLRSVWAASPPANERGVSAKKQTPHPNITAISTSSVHSDRPPITPDTDPTSRPTTKRAALSRKDQNAALAPMPVLTKKEFRNMGYDKTTNPSHTTTARPQMPALSASATRGLNRTPLTPKIASTASRSPHTPSVITTPLARRPQPPVHQQQQQQSQQRSTPSNTARSPYDEPAAASPFGVHLSSNITPRSGARQNRVDSANSTPNGTPNPDRSGEWDARSSFPLASPQVEGDPAKRPLVTFSAVSAERNGSAGRQDASNVETSKFFHASDIKTAGGPTSASKTLPPKGPTFFYANATSIPSRPVSPGTLSPSISPAFSSSQENVSSKFMYANGAPEGRPPPISRPSGSSISSTSRVPTARSAVGLQRPISPSKMPLQPQAPVRTSGSLQGSSNRSHVTPPPLGPSPPNLRRPGTATSRSSGHSRAGSLVKEESPSELINSVGSLASSLFLPAQLSPGKPPPLSLASIIQAADEFAEHVNDASPDDIQSNAKSGLQSGLQSPTKSTHSSADVTELVANARRERKVQDLQIRNASLEAINRTLERQLRKQTAELRRYRRLSRSGRISMASTTASSRIPSETLSELQINDLALSDLSEEDAYMDELEEESFSDSDSGSSTQSPSVVAARDARHRQRDEDRLALDLTKHQQLLIDSQKVNQSIKRCMDWTEELIKEGKKALDYQVRVSDVKLGGRVLDPLDEEDDTSKLLQFDDTLPLDDTIPLDSTIPLGEAVPPSTELTRSESEPPTSWALEPQDRDSGIELPKEGA